MSSIAPEIRSFEFRFRAPAGTKAVSVAGDFNHWNDDEGKMTKDAKGVWRLRLDLPVGSHVYKFRLDTGAYVLDPKQPSRPDGNGNVNSLLLLPPSSFEGFPGKLGDGILTESALRHRASEEDLGRIDAQQFWFRVRTRAQDVESVTLRIGEHESHLRVVHSDGLYDTWQGAGTVSTPGAYEFEIRDGATTKRLGPYHADFGAWPLPAIPSWTRGAVYYQIFPDRFANGDPSNDGPSVEQWGSKPTYRNRMGGDLKGISSHLDHLKDLGVDCLYLCPVFKAGSNHGYDTYDYMLVDPRFGSNRDLRDLVEKAHSLGIKVILDAVFNHTGTGFFAFEDVRYHGEHSDYRDWYFIKRFPVQVERGQDTYRTFATSASMPKLNTDYPAARNYLLNAVRYWMEFAKLDGWRLDVADEVSPDFWREFRKVVKGANPEAVIIGEIWPDAHKWLQGDQHDSVMNYRWREAACGFFGREETNAQEFEDQLARLRQDYPTETLQGLYQLLDSHDTRRLHDEMAGDKDKIALSIAFQFAYPGAPAIYYGDEVGMEGGGDPDCRRCMTWDSKQWNQDLLTLYKDLIALRRRRPALRTGDYRWISGLPDGVFGFARQAGNETIEVYLNRSKLKTRIRTTARVLLGSRASQGQGNLDIGPGGFAFVSAES